MMFMFFTSFIVLSLQLSLWGCVFTDLLFCVCWIHHAVIQFARGNPSKVCNDDSSIVGGDGNSRGRSVVASCVQPCTHTRLARPTCATPATIPKSHDTLIASQPKIFYLMVDYHSHNVL
jgi:hypothetical protein